jgi:monovalent cation:H+ antiporter-2, CPA2 family
MHSIDFIQDLAVIMLIAGLVTILFHRLKQPVVLGYILAGVIIGPHTPPFVLIRDEHTIRTLSELGVVFLLFSLGLEFSLRKLARVGLTALVGAVTEIAVMLGIGWGLGRWFGWSALSASILPPWEWLLAILASAGALSALLWKWFVRLHTKLQIALVDTLSAEGDHR